MTRIFVSGANGFIGSHVSRRLLEAGHTVRGLVRRSSDLSFLEGLEMDLRQGDVTEPASLSGSMNGVDVVVHVAGFASDWGAFKTFHDVNCMGTKHLALAAREAGVERFVHISSTAVHGFAGYRNIDERHPMPATWIPYCETKRRAEDWLFGFSKKSAMAVCALRPGNVYGPKDHTFMEKYLRAMESGTAGYVDGGRHLTCPTYVENLVDAVERACFEPKAKGEAFLVTDGLDIDWKTFTETLARALGIRAPRLSVPFRLGYGIAYLMEKSYGLFRSATPPHLTRYRILNAGRDYHFSIQKSRDLLGFEPAIGLEEAVKRTVAWYLHRRNDSK
jgi:nucleoside-diphosphate-sugar epimerase